MVGSVLALVGPLATADPYDMGHQAGTILGCVLIGLGILKCASIVRRETTNAKCVIGLMMVLCCWLTLQVGSILKPHLGNMVYFMAGPLALIFMTIGILLAILGLIEIANKDSHYTQGKSQAIWSIILSVTILTLVSVGFVRGRNLTRARLGLDNIPAVAGNRHFEVDELNVQMELPGAPWVKVNSEAINPDACLVLMRQRPRVMFMVIAEDLGGGVSLDTSSMVEIAKANLAGAAREVKVLEERSHAVDEIEGAVIRAKLMTGATPQYYVNWVSAYNGFVYQLICVGEEPASAVIDTEFRDLTSRFSLISKTRQGGGLATRFDAYESEHIGLSVDLTDKGWATWKDFKQQNPEADIGALCLAEGGGFLAVPFVHGSYQPDMQALSSCFLEYIGAENAARTAVVVNEEDVGTLRTRVLEFSQFIEAQEYNYRAKIWGSTNCSLVVWAWTPTGNNLAAEADQLFASIRVSAEKLATVQLDALDYGVQLAHPDHFNRTGLYYLRQPDYRMATAAFKRAAELRPTEVLYPNNVLTSLSMAGKHAEALEYIGTLSKDTRKDPVIEAWLAWHQLNAGQRAEALRTYDRLFASGGGALEDLGAYADVLAQDSRWDDVDRVFEAYFKRDQQFDVKLLKARILATHGKHEEAITYLNTLQSSAPSHVGVALMLVESHGALGEDSESLAICEALIERGNRSHEILLAKAQTEYRLGWYRKAKKTLSAAQTLAPLNEDIRGFMRVVSGTLGEGDNTSIQEAIEPVALPESIRKLCDNVSPTNIYKGFGSVTLHDVSVYAFKRNESSTSTRYWKVSVRDASGVSRHSTLRIEFDPLSEKIYVNKLVVWNGTNEVSRGNVADYYVIDSRDGYEASYHKTLCIPVPNLQAGHTIEFVVSRLEHGGGETFSFKRHLLFGGQPAELQAVCYQGDRDAIRWKTRNGLTTTPMTDGASWIVSPCPAYEWKPFLPPLDVSEPLVVLADKELDWKADAAEYCDRIDPSLKLDAQVKTLADKITAGLQGNEAMTKAVLEYVQKNYTYKAIEFGVRGQVPNTASVTVRNRYGDCKDLAVLTHALLKAVSIPSHLALICSTYDLIESVPSMDQFDHMILFIPDREDYPFVDLTLQSSDIVTLPPLHLAGKAALILDRDALRFDKISDCPPDSSKAICSSTVTIDGEDLRVQDELALSGYCAETVRSALKGVDESYRRLWMQQTIGRYEPYSHLETLEFEGLFENSSPLVVNVSYRIPNRRQNTAQGAMVKTPSVWARYYLDAHPSVERKKSVYLRYPFVLDISTEIPIPAGFALGDSSDPIGVEDQPATWKSSLMSKDSRVHMNVRCELTPGLYPPEAYDQLRTSFEKVLRNATRDVHLIPKE